MNMSNGINIFLVFIILCLNIAQCNSRTYWKKRYTDTSVWADTLYSDNLKLCDSVRYYKDMYRTIEDMYIQDTTFTINLK